jgi:hypothetical protein
MHGLTKKNPTYQIGIITKICVFKHTRTYYYPYITITNSKNILEGGKALKIHKWLQNESTKLLPVTILQLKIFQLYKCYLWAGPSKKSKFVGVTYC